MPDPTGAAPSEDAARIEELLRVNAELGAEIRDLQAGRIDQARSAAMPSARRLARLAAERDDRAAEAAGLRAELRRVEAHNQELGRHIHALSMTPRGLVGRLSAWARSLRRPHR